MKTDICEVAGCDRIRDIKQNRRICQMHRVRYGRYKSFDLPEKEKLPDGIEKICLIHGELTNTEIYKNDNYKWAQCLYCKKDTMNRFKEKNPNRNTNILKKHFYVRNSMAKISKDDYELMLIKQNNVCAICLNPEIIINSKKSTKPKRLSIDHCHKTEKIRGLLCHSCNLMIGLAKDSINILETAINYLKEHQ